MIEKSNTPRRIRMYNLKKNRSMKKRYGDREAELLSPRLDTIREEESFNVVLNETFNN